MRAGFKAWLHEDQKSAREAARARTTPEAERLWQLLEKQQLQTLAPELDALLERQRPELSSLSAAGHLRALHLPVYLLHGSHDSVIPPSETDAAHLELDGAEHQALVSPLVSHSSQQDAGLGGKLALFVPGEAALSDGSDQLGTLERCGGTSRVVLDFGSCVGRLHFRCMDDRTRYRRRRR